MNNQNKTPLTNAEKQRRFRVRRSKEERKEIRGIYGTDEEELKIKAYAEKIIKKPKPA